MTEAEWAELKVGDSINLIGNPKIRFTITEVNDLNTPKEQKTKASWESKGWKNPQWLMRLENKDGIHTWHVCGDGYEITA